MPAKPYATAVVQRLVDAGFTAYFAGGWVRDYLMKRKSDDIDIATNASVEEMQKLFPKTIPVGVAFGIVIVVMDGHHFEVATFRRDHGYVDGRRPTGVEPTTPEGDAQRRDFTINGMFYDPLTDQIYDYVGGRKDIELGVIRAIGDPHARFAEDRLRMMRAVRYATRFGFPIEEKTRQAIRAHASQLLPAVAMERVWQEFKKMSQFAHFDQGLVSLHELGLLGTIFPELKDVSTAEIRQRVRAIPEFPKGAPAITELLELFPRASIELCEQLKLSNVEQAFVSYYLYVREVVGKPLEPVEWAKIYANPEADMCLRILAVHQPPGFLEEHAARQLQLQRATQRIQEQRPVVRAEMLIEKGIAPGKTLGLLLKEAERIAVNENVEDPQKVIEVLKRSELWPK